MAFCKCCALRDFRLNADIQELGFLCFWRTGIADVEIPDQVRKTPEQLGVGPAGSKVLHLPNAVEVATYEYFRESDVEKVIVPSGVRVLGEKLFSTVTSCARSSLGLVRAWRRSETIASPGVGSRRLFSPKASGTSVGTRSSPAVV